MAFRFLQALRHLEERDIGVTQRMQLSKAAYRAWGARRTKLHLPSTIGHIAKSINVSST